MSVHSIHSDVKDVDEEKISSSPSIDSPFLPMSEEEFSKIQRRIDLRIMPWLCFTYLVMRIDVNNTSNAAVMNSERGHDIEQELHLSAQQWAWAIACFYYPYGFLEPLSTLPMKKTTPSIWIGRIMITWGIIACCIAAVQNYAGLITTRVLLGAAEAGYYPCIIYYLAFWYQPEELALRIAVFYSFGQVSGFVAGFLAYAISFADGSLAGWRWMFIIEGIPAFLMGIANLFILPDFPQTARFLNEREKQAVINRLSAYSPSKASKTWDSAQVRGLLLDPTFWTFSLVWFCHGIGGFGITYVLPTVIYDLGFVNSAMSNVMSMPPYMGTFLVLNVLGWLVQKRGWNPFRVAAGLEFVNIICCIILLTVKVTIVKYLALLVSISTVGSVYPILWPTRVKVARGTTAAAIAIGSTNALAQFSGILGPQVFLSTYGPSYRISFIVCVVLLAVAILGIFLSEIFVKISIRKYGLSSPKAQ